MSRIVGLLPLDAGVCREERGYFKTGTNRGTVFGAVIFGAGLHLLPFGATAQTAEPLDCLPGSTGKPSVTVPFLGGMCDLGTLQGGPKDGGSRANAVSANGTVVVGFAQTDTANNLNDAFNGYEIRAYRWDTADGGMIDLGTLGPPGGTSNATDVSADGAVVVGFAETNDGAFGPFGGNLRAFRWDAASESMKDLGTLQTGTEDGSSSATAVSTDGTVVVGSAATDGSFGPLGPPGSPHAFRWDATSADMMDLGTLQTGTEDGESYALAVSADGAVVVGEAETDQATLRAFRWDTDTKDMMDLGTLQAGAEDGSSGAYAVSADGTVIVGDAETDDGSGSGQGNFRAFRWDTASGDMIDLGTLQSGVENGSSSVTAGAFGVNPDEVINADGSVVVGRADTDDGNQRAFRWDTFSQDMIDLGTLQTGAEDGSSVATAVSANGIVVVGRADTDDGNQRAFRWDVSSQDMIDLGTLQSGDEDGESVAWGVSADGSIIVGDADTDQEFTIPGFGGPETFTQQRAFIWRTEMQDFENLMLSFPMLANNTEIAVARQQSVVGRLMDETCFAGREVRDGVPSGFVPSDDFDTQKFGSDSKYRPAQAELINECFVVGGWLSGIGSSTTQNIGDRTSAVATLTYGVGVDDQMTLGGTLSVGGGSLSDNGFDMGTSVGVSLWGEYSEGALARTGWQGVAAVGWGRQSGSIARGVGLENVMLATGETSLQTFGLRATVGYGFQQEDWLITPSATLSHLQTSRGAYDEAGSDFDASYDSLSFDGTTVNLQLSGERLVSERGTLTLGAGLEHDLSADRVTLTGNSILPGMETFAVDSTFERKRTRGSLEVGYRHDYSDDRSLSGTLRVGEAPFGTAPQVNVGVNYGIRF